MRKFLLLVQTYFLSFYSFAQYPSNMNSYVAGQSTTVNFYDGSSTISMEIPPWTIAGDWHTYLVHNGIRTATYSVPNAMSPKASINCSGKGAFAVGPDASDPWKRNYSGIYSAHYLVHPMQGPIDIGFCHNENKNICGGAGNTIDPYVPIDCSRPYRGYFAMVSAVWTTSVQSDNWGQQGYNNDLGPILWPSSAFVAADGVSPASQGLLQPSSIIYDNYIYVFVVDDGPLPAGPQGQEGRERGIKLVRVPVSGCLDPTQYQVYYKDTSGNVQWLPSLPPGFTKENMLQYVQVQGPKSTDILSGELSDNTWSYRFTAAKVNNTNYFIGCEEYLDNNDITYVNGEAQARHHVALRFSYDLMNWSPREMVIETSEDWNASTFNYPILLSADGWTNTAIDLDNFYVVGTHSQGPFLNPIFMMNITNSAPAPMAAVASFRLAAPAIVGGFSGVYPNPTKGNFQLKYTLAASANVQVMVVDITGRQLQSEAPTQKPPGNYVENFDLSAFAEGVYIVELVVDNERKIYKVVRN
jgi:hypothetical protein